MIDLNSVHRIYFLGIGGIGMSAVAGMAAAENFEVFGSDIKQIYAPAKDVLDFHKISYTVGYNEQNIIDRSADLYILSAGEDLNNPEVKYIYGHNLPHASFAELLYHLNEQKLRVVVTGTNGKSTTTGLLGHVLKNIDNSSFVTGAVIKNYDSNFYHGDGHYIVVEGDEYKAEFDDPTPKFHYYKPDILVLTNLEYDHPDLFGSFEDYESEFDELIQNMPPDGLIIYNADDAELAKLVHKSNISQAGFGFDDSANFKIENVQYGPEYTSIEILNKFSKNVSSHLMGLTEDYKIQLPGKINVYNAVAVIATLRTLGFSQEQIALELLTYRGLKRRFEVLGEKNGITIVDDYAHHPTAVRETLEAAKLKYPNSKIWAVFEPHTFSRTKATLNELVKSFDAADQVLISQIYPAREKASAANITSEEVVEKIKAAGGKGKIRLVHNKQDALTILKSETRSGDVVVVMAVGDFNRLGYELKEIL